MANRSPPGTSAAASRAKRRTARIEVFITPSIVHQVELETPEGTQAFDCAEDAHIWDAAAAHGILLPAICHQGRCLTCAGRLLEGRVEHDHPDTYFAEDAAEGYVLLCRAQPRSAVRIRTHQENQMREFRLSKGLPAPYA